MLSRLRAWVVDRFGWDPIRRNFLDRRVPKTPWYYGDGATLAMLLLIQVITGAFMTPTYAPTPDTAYASVQHITEEQTLGWFVRGLHYWSAGVMVVLVVMHLLRQVLVAGYKAPREGTWLVGVVMLLLVVALSFTGYLLRWDERAVYGVHVMLTMFQRVPLIGEELVVFVQGGRELGQSTLTRLYSVHVIFAPLLLLALTAWHVYLVVIRGITSPAERRQPVATAEAQQALYHEAAESAESGEVFHPEATFRSGRYAMVVLALVVTLTLTLGPRELMEPGNLLGDAAPTEEWWFWWYSAIVALLPDWLAPIFVVLSPVLLFLALVALPLLDRGPQRGMRKRPWAVGTVVVVALGLLALSDLRRRSPWTGMPRHEPPDLPAGITLPPEVEEGRLLFARYGCSSCHAVAGHGPQLAVDLARVPRRSSIDAIRAFILQPPEGVSMPSYAGRMAPEDLERVARFVHAAQTFPRTSDGP